MSIGVSLDFVGFGTKPGVLHRAKLGLNCATHVGEGSFLCHAGGVILVGPKQAVFFFQQGVNLAVVLVEPVLVVSGSRT